MKRTGYTARVLLAVSLLAASLVLGATAPTPTVTPTVPPTTTSTPTPSASPTATVTPTLEPSPTSTASPTIGLPPTPTAAPTTPAYTPPPAGLPASQLPQTAPGVSRNEGTFLITAADDGSRAAYFIAGNARHSVLQADLQLEMQLNPLWPVRQASPDEVLAIVEGAPVGQARTGLLSGPITERPAAQVTSDPRIEQPSVVEMPVQQPTYIVLQAGDNLTRIAERYNTSVQAILDANHITNANLIFFGKTLVIPGASESAPAVAELPTLVADTPNASADVPPEAVAPMTYTVRAGDSAIGIARQFGVELDTLLASNSVADRNRIYVGQVLTIPAASS